MPNLDTEDWLLEGGILIAILATLADAAVASTAFKVLKIVALVLCLGLAVHRIRASKPFVLDIEPDGWLQAGDEFEYRILRKVHGRGKTPRPRSLVRDIEGFAEGFTDMVVDKEGTVIYRVSDLFHIRTEIRK